MYETIEHARASSADGFCISPLDLKKLCTVACGDSSFANAPGGKTQQGHITTLTETSCATRETRASIVDWRSGRAHRVVRSTLAGEAAACDNAADSGVYTARFMAEVIYGRQRARQDLTLVPLYICTDCKSLYDAIKQVTPSLSEKRATIDIMSIKESVSTGGGRVMWLPTLHMKADGLTKMCKTLRKSLLSWQMNPIVTLREQFANSFEVVFNLVNYKTSANS